MPNTPNIIEPSPEKRTFSTLLLILAVVLMILPFITTFNDVLTRIVMKVELYQAIQEKIVPLEIEMISVVMNTLGFEAGPWGQYLAIEKGSETFLVEIAWNCIGWQSFIILIFSFLTGLLGNYTKLSKLEVVLTGFFGTFLINLLRITLVSIFAYFFGQFPAIIFHDYGSILITIFWLIFFWWFSFVYILEPKRSSPPKEKVPKRLVDLRK